MISITLLIPAYNEQATIANFFKESHAVLENLKADFEIIVCDDASQDATKSIIERLVVDYPQTRAIYHSSNQGLFKTFEELYQAATKDWVILFPADGQWSPSLLPEAVEALQGHDVVIAARRHKQYTLFRKINSWMFNGLVKLLYGVDLYDIGAVKLVRRKLLQGIPVKTQSAFSEAERLLKAHKAGYKIKAIWVEHHERTNGKASGARFEYILQSFKDLIVFRFCDGKGH